MTIGAVAGRFDMTRAAVKKHLTVLTDGGLVEVETRGRTRVNRLVPQGMNPVIDWLATFDLFWDERLEDLKSAIEKDLQ